MFNVLVVGHRNAYPVPEFLRPFEGPRHLRHILMDAHLALVCSLLHVCVIDLLGYAELRLHHGRDLGVVAVEVLLDHRPLQEGAEDVKELQENAINPV